MTLNFSLSALSYTTHVRGKKVFPDYFSMQFSAEYQKSYIIVIFAIIMNFASIFWLEWLTPNLN